MKAIKYFLLIISFLLSQWLLSQESEIRLLEPFNKIDVEDKILVQLVKSDEESLEVKAQGIDLQRVMSTVTDNILKMYIQVPPYKYGKVNIILKFKKLNEIRVSGVAEVSSASLLKMDTLFVNLRSGGKAYLDLDIQHLESKIAEGALLSAEGYAVSQNAYVTTSGTLSAFKLESDIVNVKAVSTGKVKIYVEKEFTGLASTKGYIGYKGEPVKIDKKVYTGGEIVKFEE